jgi:flagellar basal-body rod protein FlgC
VRVAWIVPRYPPVAPAGAEWTAHELLVELAHRGHHAAAIVTGRERNEYLDIAGVDDVVMWTAQTAGGDPYRRKVPTFSSALDRTLDAKVVTLGRIRPDPTAFRIKHDPGNPAADAAGNVKYPNVNSLVEMTDMRDAQRSYEANLNIISATRRMIQRTLDILKA